MSYACHFVGRKVCSTRGLVMAFAHEMDAQRVLGQCESLLSLGIGRKYSKGEDHQVISI